MAHTVAPPVGEEVRRARRAEHREVEDERDHLRAAIERGRDDVAGVPTSAHGRTMPTTGGMLESETYLYFVNQRG